MILAFALAIASTSAPAAVAPTPPAKGCAQGQTPDAIVCRALEDQNNGNMQGAAQGFEDAAKASSASDSKTSGLWAAAGNLWIAAGQQGKAAAALDRALAAPGLSGVQRGEALLDRARAAEAQDDLKTARARLTEARSTISDDPFYWYFSAALAIREADVATAQSSIGEALKLAPSDPTILFEAGHVAHFAGDDAKARHYWNLSSTGDPTGPSGKSARAAIALLPSPQTIVTKTPAKR